MPNLTYPSPYPFSDGDVVTASGVQGLIYSGTDPASSLAILNGFLDEANLFGDDVGAEHTQKGSHVESRQVAGTVSLDYFDDLWGDHTTASWSSSQLDEAVVIPGASVDFYMPWAGFAILRWTVFWSNTSNTEAERSAMFLTFDDAYQTNQHRYVSRCINTAAAPPVHEGYKCSRVWSGHHCELTTAGWHSARIKLIGDDDVQQTRVWARNMIVTKVKWSA